MAFPGLYLPVFQTGYVTNDLDQAIRLFTDTQGIGKWYRSPTGTLPSPDGGTNMVAPIAVAMSARGVDDAVTAILPA